jgi:hypothetical protein
LKSVDVRAPSGNASVESMEYPGKSCSPTPERVEKTLSYQRNRLTPRRQPPHETKNWHHCVDGAFINSSSTFGTLLSSQGSCAHRCQASRPGAGAPELTYRVGRRPSNRFLAPEPHSSRPFRRTCDSVVDSVVEGRSSWGLAGPAARSPRLSKVLRPVASGEAGGNLTWADRQGQIASPWPRSRRKTPGQGRPQRSSMSRRPADRACRDRGFEGS